MNTSNSAAFSYRHAGVENHIRQNFQRQGFLLHMGASLGDISPGYVEILLPFGSSVDQQHGYFHGGAIATIADGAAGAAAQTLVEKGASVLTTEFKINFVAPAKGDQLIACGRVISPRRTLTVCQSDIYAENSGDRTLIATALLTMICVPASRNKEKNHVAK